MKNVFNINGHEVEFSECSAIYPEDGRRRHAILVHDMQDEFGKGDGVVFFYPGLFPVDEREAEEVVASECYLTDEETLKSVEIYKEMTEEEKRAWDEILPPDFFDFILSI